MVLAAVPAIETHAKTEVTLSPAVRRTLQLQQRRYHALKCQIAIAEEEMAIIKASIEKTFVDGKSFDALIDGVSFEGFKYRYVSPVTARLDKKCLLAQGVTMGQIDNALAANTKPGKPYLRINCPGDRDAE